MTKEELRIVYMGTPDFAVETLRLLVENKYNVVAVVTMPDKPAGRGHKIQFSPVKQYALSVGLPILQPVNLKDEAFIEELRSYQAHLQIVVAFRMLPQIVWDMPPMGTFNLHASLLPQYRGAAPLNWAIMNGDKETGITTFFLTHEIDTGRVIQRRSIEIADTEFNRIIKITKEGSKSTVVWNPNKDMAEAKRGQYNNFICVEPANVGENFITLAPNQKHKICMTIEVKDLGRLR